MSLLSGLVHLVLAVAATMSPAPTVALTFDDGPGPHTAQILDALESAGAVGTFFVVGDQLPGREQLVADLVDAGMSLQWHSASHPDLTGVSDSRLAAELDIPGSLPGPDPSCVRPPYGATDSRVNQAATGAGLEVTLWGVDPRDWAATSSQQVIDAVMADVEDGSVVLLHGREHTANALPQLLERLHGAGFQTVLLCA
ncbi:polysaccharide deacetylase family protein [Ornithinimicrobium murale]|uniref:polysaccharide deacetylase family protein n=1 Tax=Ornithinimicrobium murale TaxID=1050153 RepID=UPI000E0CF43C|nr:polysaccharide deacetylase family protein [Ornithinimicrobium murale]